MSGAVATFDYEAWRTRYPEFEGVSDKLAELYFAEATLYHANDGSGPVEDAGIQLLLLNMLTAHVAARYAQLGGQPASPLVGRISNAQQGSVSVATELPNLPSSAAWYAQTKYGLDYWSASAPYRTMRYRVGRRRVFDPLLVRRPF